MWNRAFFLALFACSAPILALPAPGEVRIRLTGEVDLNLSNDPTWQAIAKGSYVEMTFRVGTPGTNTVPGHETEYAVDPASFRFGFGGPGNFPLTGTPTISVEDDVGGIDSIELGPFLIGSTFSMDGRIRRSLFEFGTTDLKLLAGAYDLDDGGGFSSIFFYGNNIYISMQMLAMTIEPPLEGQVFCDPMELNSTGFPTGLHGYFGSGVGSDLHLEAVGGPFNEFGYFLVGTGVSDPGVVVSDGRLCLNFAAGNQVARFNVAGTPRNSLGVFSPAGILINQSGTSGSSTGFDVPSQLPFPGSPMVTAGQTLHFQLWHRDTPAGGGHSNFSNGLSVTF